MTDRVVRGEPAHLDLGPSNHHVHAELPLSHNLIAAQLLVSGLHSLGLRNINDTIFSTQNPHFVLHDFQGFEPRPSAL
jgi:hypothetical protein